VRALLDTSVLISDEPPADIEAAISVGSIAELHFGVLAAPTTTSGPDAPSVSA
jgi:toxin FitB